MVDIYFDLQFIISFGQRKDLTDPIISDFYNKFIKEIRGVKVFVNVASISELNELVLNNELFYLISEISPILLCDFKEKLSNNSFYSEGAITKLFFIENCDEQYLQNKFSYYFISNRSLKEKWKLFLSDREDSELLIKSNPQKSEKGVFHSWKDLNLFAHKIKNILVFDLYVMSNKTNQKIENNFLPCIKELISTMQGKVDQLTIFTKDLQGLWQEKDLNVLFTHFKVLSTHINNICVVKYDVTRKSKGDSEHNRYILTNYFLIRLGAGINIFKDNGKVNNSDSIKFDSILKNRIRNIALESLNNLKQYTSQLKEKDTKAAGPNQVFEFYNFYPNLNCNFLS